MNMPDIVDTPRSGFISAPETNVSREEFGSDADPMENFFEKCVYQTYRVTVPFIFALVVLVGTLGNILVIYVILSRKHLRSITNILLANLAVADICFLLLSGTFTTVHYALEEWPLSDVLCRVIQFLLYTTCYVTVYTLIAVSVVRFVTVVYGTNYKFLRSKRYVIILIILIWIAILLTKIPILLVHGVSFNELTNRTECIVSGQTQGRELFASFFIFAYALPLVVIVTLYLLILCHLKKKQQNTLGENGIARKRMEHVTKLVILVVAVFALCWLPLHIHLLVGYYGNLPSSTSYSMLLIVWHCLVFANSILNPIIYNFFAKDFREAFTETICCSSHPTDV